MKVNLGVINSIHLPTHATVGEGKQNLYSLFDTCTSLCPI